VAAVFVRMDHASELASFIKNLYQRFRVFGGDVRLFEPKFEPETEGNGPLGAKVKALSGKVLAELMASHSERPFHLVHCHDWCSSTAGLAAKKTLGLPMVLSLHSTEAERTHGQMMSGLSPEIRLMEEKAVEGADLVIVPHSSTRQQIISLYGALPDRVAIVPDVFMERPPALPSGPSEVKRWFGLNQDAPLVLFSGEVSHASGADLLADALPTVCRNHATAQFVFAGDGPLRAELEGRVRHAGIGHRCRFLGDVPRETFEALLTASDFVVIPARTWQDEGLAQMAIGSGRPVLTTHQAGINCVKHGENGLVTFDNPGSIVWGLQELLFNPLKGSMLQLAARKKAVETPSLQNIAAQHYMYYEMLLRGAQGAADA
jgi:glycosyltransferase involved in cell wall biosynthesis